MYPYDVCFISSGQVDHFRGKEGGAFLAIVCKTHFTDLKTAQTFSQHHHLLKVLRFWQVHLSMEQHTKRNPDGLEGVSEGLKVNLSQRSRGKLFLMKSDTYIPLTALEKNKHVFHLRLKKLE